MDTIEVIVHEDYLDELIKVNPKDAISELIWNSLDADAEKINLSLKKNQFDSIDEIIVEDDGVGLEYKNAKKYFGQLGYSWKKYKDKTTMGRVIHGQIGRGRFLVFKVGSQVEWTFTTSKNGKFEWYNIQKERNEKYFFLTKPSLIDKAKSGTRVNIYNISEKCQNFLTYNSIKNHLLKNFSLYLMKYSSVEINYDGNKIDPKDAIERKQEFVLELNGEQTYSFRLEIIEWKKLEDKALCLCDEDGFFLFEEKLNINTHDLKITAYLKSDFFKDFSEDKYLIKDSDDVYREIIKEARKKVKGYCDKRKVELSSNIINVWKNEGVYPFEREPDSKIEHTKRQVFDLVALSVNEYLPRFAKENTSNKKFTFRLLREAIESNPNSTTKILKEILNLPEEKINEFAELLERTTLTSIINASKLIADRLDFLVGLENILFREDYKKALKERSQLHKIISQNTWIFGEKYNLSASDRSLTNVLRKYIKDNNLDINLLDNSKKSTPVLDSEGKSRVIDLMLSCSIPQSDKMKKEYLIVELKRPSVKIGDAELIQIKNYARTISNDERFRVTDTKWEFWAISNKINETIEDEVHQKDRPRGLVLPTTNYNIWVKPWSQIIRECEARLIFFKEALGLEATDDTGMAFLNGLYHKYLPYVNS